MASFAPAYALVAEAEGGYQNHPNDTGNYNSRRELVGTNWGISAPVYEDWIGRPPTAAEMRAMSATEARSIYKARFWDDILGDHIQSQDVANIFFDGRVNHGRTGVRLMQRVLGVAQDGIVGLITLQALNRANPVQVFEQYKEARRAFYHQLVNNNQDYRVFLQGWLNRLANFSTSSVGISSGVILTGIALYFLFFENSRS